MLEIKAGYEGAIAVFDLAKGIGALKSETAKNAAIMDIQRHAVEAQQGLAASLKRIDELEKEIVRLEDWAADKERYELAEAGQGSFAYRLKEGMEQGEPPHWICPHCYQKGQKSLLKHEIVPVRADALVCHPCGYDVITRGVRNPQGMSVVKLERR